MKNFKLEFCSSIYSCIVPKLGGFKQPLYSLSGFGSSGVEAALSWVVFLLYMVSTEVTHWYSVGMVLCPGRDGWKAVFRWDG